MAKNKRKQLNKVTKYMNYKQEKQKKKKSKKERRKKGEAVGVQLPRRELSFASCVSRIYHLQRRLWLPQQSDDSIDRAHSGVQTGHDGTHPQVEIESSIVVSVSLKVLVYCLSFVRLLLLSHGGSGVIHALR